MAPSLTIRHFAPGDLPVCAAIFAEGAADVFGDAPAGPPDLAFRSFTAGEDVIVADGEDAGVVGFAAIFTDEAFIHHLYVARPHRGRGAGAALLAAARHYCGRRTSLKCREVNLAARAFYERQSWTEAERGTDHTGPWIRFVSPD